MLPVYYGGTVKFYWHVRCWGSTALAFAPQALGETFIKGDLAERS
jgi:hypothetical protein